MKVAITEKRCGKCRQVKPVGEFYKSTRDGYRSRCKPCHHEDVRIYNRNPAVKRRMAEFQRRYYRDPKLKMRYKARIFAHRMTANGTIEQQPCAFCGSEQSQRHHPDYEQPLLIVWLCAICHKKLHKQQRKE